MIVERPIGLYSARQAAKLRHLITSACANIRRNGGTVDPDIVEFESDVKRLAALHEADRGDAYADRGIPADRHEPGCASIARMGSRAVATMINRSERDVTDLARRGTLHGTQERRGGTWSFDVADVDDYIARREGN
jgi:hypothetical protein